MPTKKYFCYSCEREFIISFPGSEDVVEYCPFCGCDMSDADKDDLLIDE